MRAVIVDLDRSLPVSRARPADRLAIAALSAALLVFALAVALDRTPVGLAGPIIGSDPNMWTPTEQRALTLVPPPVARLELPRDATDIVLSAMPDRFVNEPGDARLRAVIDVRGKQGVAAIELPATIMWTEQGITYWMTSPDRTTAELIAIADGLR